MPEINILQILILIAIILVSMTIHESMHAFVAYWLGDETARDEGRLTLNPLAHIDPFMTVLLPVLLMITGAPIFGGAKPVPFNPSKVRYGEFGAMLVGIAGPLTNLVLAFLITAIYIFSGASGIWGDTLRLAITVNLGFFIFNMIPIPPLDGSRVLYYLAPDTARRAMASLENYGIILILVIIVLFGEFLGSYMITAIQFFLHIFISIFSAVI